MSEIPTQIDSIRNEIDAELLKIPNRDKVRLFYDPIHYANRLKGKRLRPLLTIISGLGLGGEMNSLLHPATAIELLHNFTLVHDDIMDNDDLRRGQETVHVKWDVGTAILAGDGLLGFAYQMLLGTPCNDICKIANLFTDALIDICEGQALDKTFESIDRVSESEYLDMINKKTAVLIKLSCQLGALTTNADDETVQAFADFGYNIGMGFQIQDDLLDVFAEETTLGKNVGSDLEMQKKTILTIKLAEKGKLPESTTNIDEVKSLLMSEGIIEEVKGMTEQYFDNAYKLFNRIENNDYAKMLKYLTEYIINRDK